MLDFARDLLQHLWVGQIKLVQFSSCDMNEALSSAVLHCNSLFVRFHIERWISSLTAGDKLVIHLRRNPDFPHKLQLLHRRGPRRQTRKLFRRKDVDAKHADGGKPLEDWIEMKISHAVVWTYNEVKVKAKVAHTRLPSLGFRSTARFLAVSLRVAES